jgi:hypothetical protein
MTNKPEILRSKLLVIVPDDELDEVKFAKKARSLAEYYNLDILFFGIVTSSENEPSLRRKLITLAGISSNNIFKTHFLTHSNTSWLKAIAREFVAGDYILCPKEFIQTTGKFFPKSILQLIKDHYGDRLITVSGLMVQPQQKKSGKYLFPIIYWAGIIIILTTAFGLEADFGNQTFGWVRAVGEISIVGIEIFSLWVWNSITNRG